MKTLEGVLRETLTNKLDDVHWEELTAYGVHDAIDDAINEIDFNEDYEDMKRERDRQAKIAKQLDIINAAYLKRIEEMKCCGNCNSWQTDECSYTGGPNWCCQDDWTPFVEKSAARLAFQKTDSFLSTSDVSLREQRWLIFEEGYNTRKDEK